MGRDLVRAWIEVDLAALLRNARRLAERAAVPLLPMVKADAYGLGAVPVARALLAAHPWGFGVATVDEGNELRQAGIQQPIVVFTPILESEIAAVREATLTPTLGDRDRIEAWTARGGGVWHLAVDTGMHRAGVRWSDLAALERALRRHPPEGVFTHFYSADREDGSLARQLERFEHALAAMPVRPPIRYAENSAAIERLGVPSIWSVARPGVFLYGAASRADGIRADPVVALRARIVELHTVDDGDGVSYGWRYRAQGTRRIATVAAGYADGYHRAFSAVGHAIVNGRRVRVAGTVTMDMTMLDVTGVRCAIGDVATLLGVAPPSPTAEVPQGIDLVSAARDAGLVAYEILTGLGSRLPRVYLGAPDV